MTDYQRLESFISHLGEFLRGDDERIWLDSAGGERRETIDAAELRRGLVEDAMYFSMMYGADTIPQYIQTAIVGPMGGKSNDDVQQAETDLSKLRAVVFSRDIPTIYDEMRPVFDEITETIRELKDAKDKYAELLNEIMALQKKDGARLEDIWGILKSQEAREAKKAGREVDQKIDTIREMLCSISQKIDKNSNQICNMQKGVTMMLASNAENYTPTYDDIKKWYGVTERTFQYWKSGKIKCPYWPGIPAPQKIYIDLGKKYKRAHIGKFEENWMQGETMLDKREINNGYNVIE